MSSTGLPSHKENTACTKNFCWNWSSPKYLYWWICSGGSEVMGLHVTFLVPFTGSMFNGEYFYYYFGKGHSQSKACNRLCEQQQGLFAAQVRWNAIKYTCTRRCTLCIVRLVMTCTVFVQNSYEPPNVVWFVRSWVLNKINSLLLIVASRIGCLFVLET